MSNLYMRCNPDDKKAVTRRGNQRIDVSVNTWGFGVKVFASVVGDEIIFSVYETEGSGGGLGKEVYRCSCQK